MRKFNNTKILYLFTCFLFITQACNKDQGNSDVKATLQKDSIKIELRTKSVELNKNDMKYKLDMIDGVWYICKRFSEISYTDTIRNPTTILVVSNKVISKFNKNKLIFTDSLVQTKNSHRLTEFAQAYRIRKPNKKKLY